MPRTLELPRLSEAAVPSPAQVLMQVLASAGYGLWMLLGLALALGLYDAGRGGVLVPLVLGCLLVSAGLVAACLHWRAVPDWHGWSPGRSAWPGREAMVALLVYLPMLAVAGLARGDNAFWATRLGGAALALCSAISLVSGARVMRRSWPAAIVAAVYSGGLWLWLCVTAQDDPGDPATGDRSWILALLMAALVLGLIEGAYWQALERTPPRDDADGARAADGLARFRLFAAVLVYGLPCLALLVVSLHDNALPLAVLAALGCLWGRLIEQRHYALALVRAGTDAEIAS